MSVANTKLDRLLIALVFGMAVFAPFVFLFGQTPLPGQVVLLVGWQPLAVAQDLGLRLVGPETAPLAVFALLESTEQLSEIKTSRAWFVTDGTRLLEICT